MSRFELVTAAEPSGSFVWEWLIPGTWLYLNGETLKIVGRNRHTGKILVRR